MRTITKMIVSYKHYEASLTQGGAQHFSGLAREARIKLQNTDWPRLSKALGENPSVYRQVAALPLLDDPGCSAWPHSAIRNALDNGEQQLREVIGG